MLKEPFTVDRGYGRKVAEETEAASLRAELILMLEELQARQQELWKQCQELESLRRKRLELLESARRRLPQARKRMVGQATVILPADPTSRDML